MTTKSQLAEMLELQDKMNSKVDPDWKQTKNPFLRAVAVEGVEGLESLGWKWWKKQVPDMQNVKMELIDIWHFILSEAIIQYGPCAEEQLKNRMHNDPYVKWSFNDSTQSLDLYHGSLRLLPQQRMEVLIGFGALRAPVAYVASVFQAIRELDAKMSMDDLYKGYLAKNVLNFFRQDHGYKDGTYIKEWFGKEDNVWLTKFADELSADNALDAENLYVSLTNKYAEVVAPNTKEDDEGAGDTSFALGA